jgi:hypothetical protein
MGELLVDGRQVAYRLVGLAGESHEGLNAHLEVAWPDAAAWLLDQLAVGGR